MKKRHILISLCLCTIAWAANSSSLTDSIEKRNDEPKIKPIWMRETTFVVEADGGSSEISHTVLVNGNLREMVIRVGAAGSITGTVNVDFDDIDGVEFDTNATLGELSETIVTLSTSNGKPVNNFIIRLDPSDDPTAGQADWEIIVTCRGD